MCKEMLAISVNRVVDQKRIIRKKWKGQGGGGEAQGIADPPPPKKNTNL
jgi:hypothetical protein